MTGYLQRKKHYIVVMDGSDPKKLEGIEQWIKFIAYDHKGKLGTLCHFDKNRSSAVVYELTITDDAFDCIQFTLEDHYPGLCVFDPPM